MNKSESDPSPADRKHRSFVEEYQRKKEEVKYQKSKRFILSGEEKVTSSKVLGKRDVALNNATEKLGEESECILTREMLEKKGVLLDERSAKVELKIANLIFRAMNFTENPLYTYPSGGRAVTAKSEASRIESIQSQVPFDELDLFINLHTKNGKMELKGESEESEIKRVFEKYGVLLINGLKPRVKSTLILGCGHDNDHFAHSNEDTLDICARLKPDVLFQWGDKRATQYLSSLGSYREIVDEGPLCAFMRFSEEFFSAVRACLLSGGNLRLPTHVLDEGKIPRDFVKDASFGQLCFGTRFICTTYTYKPS